MVRIRSSSKHRKVQTEVKNKKKKRNSVSRGTETDFDQVYDTTAVNLNDSFGIWMGGKTSTPEKKDSSPSSAWYPHRRIDNNDHSAHSIVFFEETLDSSKAETKLDSPDTPTLGPITNICKTSNEDTEHESMQDKSPMQHLWQTDTSSQMGSVKDESGTLVFESSGKVFFRHGEEKETSKVVEDSLRESNDKGNLYLGSTYVSESQSFVLMEENFNLSNGNHVNFPEQNDSGELGKCCQHFRKEERDSALLTALDNTNKTKSRIKSTPYSNQSENHKEKSFPKSCLTDNIHSVTQNTSLCDESDEHGILHGLDEGNKENRSPLCQFPNKSRSRRCIALKGYDVMTDFDDAMNDVKDKVETFCYSEVHYPSRANDLLNPSSAAKFDSVFTCPPKQEPFSLSPNMTLRNLTGSDEDSSKALSDITNNANFVRARYRAPANIKIREPSMVTSRTILTQRKWASTPDKHIYSNLPSMMFPCLTNRSDTCDVSNQSKESNHPNFSKCHGSQEKENCNTRRNPSAFVPHVPDQSQGMRDHMKDQLSESPIDNSSSKDNDREKDNPGIAVNSSFPISQTANVLLARNHARSHSYESSDDSNLARGTAFRQQPERHIYKSNKLPEPSQSKSHGFPFLTTTNISISSQGNLPQKDEAHDKNPHSPQLSDTQEVRHDSPVSDHFQMSHGTDYFERKVEKLDVKNRQSEFSLEVSESSKNRQTNKNIQSQDVVHDKYLRQNERLAEDQKLVTGKERTISKVPKLLDFYENHSAKTSTGKPKSRRSCMPTISTMTVSSRVNMFEQNAESKRNVEEGIAVGREVARYESIKLKTSSSKHKNRLSLPAFSTGLSSRDEFNNVDKSYEAGLESNHFETISKQPTSRRHLGKSPNREAIVLFEFSYYVPRKREAILFQRGEVVQVLSKWIDGQVRIRKCLDKTEAILPRKCLFFISGDASITKQAGHFLYGSNYSDKASTDPLQGQSEVKAEHIKETTLLEPFLVVRPYIAASTNEVTVLRGEVIIMNAKLAQEDKSEWSWVYVPRTQGFGFVPSSVARPLTFEPVTGYTHPRT